MKKFLLAVSAVSIGFGTLFFPPSSLASFQDVPETHPYIEGISYIELQGAADSAKDFRPDEPITRAEFFKLLFIVIEEEPPSTQTPSFPDISKEAWFAPYAELALKHDLVETGPFEAEKTVSRTKGLKMLMQAYGLGAPIIPHSKREALFADVSKEHPAYSLLARAIDVGLVSSNLTQTWSPYRRLTRGESADFLYRLAEWETTQNLEENPIMSFYKDDIFSDIWNRILNDFYTRPGQEIDQDVLFQLAIEAVLSSLEDPYTTYFNEEEAEEFNQNLEAELEGIGAILIEDEKNGEIFITGLVDNAPEESKILKAGDKITAVDGVSVKDMFLEEVLNRIRGPAGTDVRLTIERDGEEKTFQITRAVIKLDLVDGKIFNENTWLLEIDSFGSNIFEAVMETLESLNTELPEPSAIILDLRGNPGGYVNMSNFVAGLFVPQLTPLVILDYGGPQEIIYNGDLGPYKDIPLYILVDAYTASAAEILTLTLQEVANATVIGQITFGKGSAQEVTSYWDGSMLKMTIAHWLSSEGNSVEGTGITPDILIEEASETTDLWLKEVKKLL